MNNSQKFLKLRKEYKEFYYNYYKIEDNNLAINIEFEFEIKGLIKFNPSLKILKKNIKFKNIDTEFIENLVFHIGMIELISYWKATCSPNVIIKCGNINKEQEKWFKKLYYYGLRRIILYK